MKTPAIILLILLIHLAVFVSYPETGRMGMTFLYISSILWTSFTFFLRSHSPWGTAWKTAHALFFSLACAFSALSFLPQKDGISALRKLSKGKYPDRRAVFIGLLRLGVDCPALLPPHKKEILP